MLTASNTTTLGILVLLSVLFIMLLNYIISRKNKKQLDKVILVAVGMALFWMLCSILQIFGSTMFNINPLYFDYFTYISICFLPVTFFFTAIIFSRTKIKFTKKYYWLFVIPTLSLIMLWTNNMHHLFYQTYSTDTSATVFGAYFYIHYIYTCILSAISLFILMKYSIKNSGFFSKQAILIFIGILIPVITNILGFLGIINVSIYVTPITFAFTILFLTLAMFKFDLLKTTPIALQRIVDRMSDSYIILNENYVITDFNATFLKTFKVKEGNVRNNSIFDIINTINPNIVDTDKLKEVLQEVQNSTKTAYFDKYFSNFNKYFRIEINTITSNQSFLGILVLFKDTTQHERDMQTIKDNQDTLMENERLASLGQLIGGIAHNLKTPIMSIAGAAEGLNDLIKEYDSSIEDKEVTPQDHHEIAHDMSVWVEKIKGYTEYMSDIITTVKGQAVTLGADEEVEFTIKELINRVDILMRHELKNALVYLNVSMKTDENTVINGDVNSLVQVINNMISNSIQAYAGKTEQNIDMVISKQDKNLVISLKDYAGGLPETVKNKLFKEMVTTKGKNGTGLGLYMSYSNIKARFNGDITFESNNEGTIFNIILPLLSMGT